jgi:hypothetical protein
MEPNRQNCWADLSDFMDANDTGCIGLAVAVFFVAMWVYWGNFWVAVISTALIGAYVGGGVILLLSFIAFLLSRRPAIDDCADILAKLRQERQAALRPIRADFFSRRPDIHSPRYNLAPLRQYVSRPPEPDLPELPDLPD